MAYTSFSCSLLVTYTLVGWKPKISIIFIHMVYCVSLLSFIPCAKKGWLWPWNMDKRGIFLGLILLWRRLLWPSTACAPGHGVISLAANMLCPHRDHAPIYTTPAARHLGDHMHPSEVCTDLFTTIWAHPLSRWPRAAIVRPGEEHVEGSWMSEPRYFHVHTLPSGVGRSSGQKKGEGETRNWSHSFNVPYPKFLPWFLRL